MGNKKPKEVQGESKRFSRSDWFAFIALIVSFCAVGTTLYFGIWEKQGDFIASRPHIVISFDYREDGAGFTFTNSGPGSAVIKHFSVSVNGKVQENWYAMMEALGIGRVVGVSFRVLYPNTIEIPRESEIFWIKSSEVQAKKILMKEHSKVRIEVCYCSFRGECWVRNNTTEAPRIDSCANMPKVQFSSPPL